MNHDDLAPLATATDAMRLVLSAARGDEPVAACPGWDVEALAMHLGSVHRWAAATVLSGRVQEEPAVRRQDEDTAQWYAATARALVAALAAVDPAEPCWTLEPDGGTAGFWRRRQLHETVIHRVDAARAVGLDSTPIAPEVAADGIDEVCDLWLRRLHVRWQRPADLPAPVLLVSTDTGRTWLLTPAEGAPPEVRRDVGPVGDQRVEGTAEALYLALWHRGDVGLRVEGPAAARFLGGTTSP
ncbi:MAG: maleylpyruvate isomerase family mycothiol-dependent enzyme [Propionibacteriales bacterium]|nr:maleylpyruvate isomerase family mycothiol-dependent enzyme [Propionibacteriales bacterium]